MDSRPFKPAPPRPGQFSGASGLDAYRDFERLYSAFASPFTQANRLITLEIGDSEDDLYGQLLLAHSVRGEESLSGPWRYDVVCLSPEVRLALKDLLGQPARLHIRDARGSPISRCGLVTEARALPSDGGFARYGLIIEPAFALLRHRRTSRVFQERSVPDIVKTILDEHLAGNSVFAARYAYHFDLLRMNHPVRSYCIQYRESDLAFIERLLAEEGIAWRFVFAPPGEEAQDDDEDEEEDERGGACTSGAGRPPFLSTQVFFDDPYSLPRAGQRTVRFHRADATEPEDSLTDWQGTRALGPGSVSLSSFEYKAVQLEQDAERSMIEQGREGTAAEQTLEDFDAQTHYYSSTRLQDNPTGLERYTRRRRQAHDRAKKHFHGAGTVRRLHAGEWFQLAEHPAHDNDPVEQCAFAVTRLTFTARNNLPGVPDGQDEAPPYRVEFEAQRRGVPLVPAYAHTAHARPTAPGLQTAVVVGPPGEREVYTDGMGRIRIQFHWQRAREHPGFGAAFNDASSCWVRVACPSAGAHWGHQFIPRVGQEVLVDFLEGDIDRPLVTGVVHNGAHPPAWFSGVGQLPANRALSGIRSREFDGAGYNELLFDDTPGQVRARLSSEPGKTQLNLGYLIHPRTDGAGQPRGEGFELRTDNAGAIRAAQGLLLSAHGRHNAGGAQLDREEMRAQLEQALAIARDLNRHADIHHAGTHHQDETGLEAQERLLKDVKHWEDGSNTAQDIPVQTNKALLAATAPDGLVLATETDINVVAGGNQDTTVVRDSNLSIGRHLRLRIAETLSVYVHKLGMKLIAAADKILIQAQDGEIEIGAAKKLHLYSLDEIVMEAPKITLRASGSEVVYSEGITSRTAGVHLRHAAAHPHKSAASVSTPLPGMPKSELATNERFAFANRAGNAKESVSYEIRNRDGNVLGAGSTDAAGATTEAVSKALETLVVQVKPD